MQATEIVAAIEAAFTISSENNALPVNASEQYTDGNNHPLGIGAGHAVETLTADTHPWALVVTRRRRQ